MVSHAKARCDSEDISSSNVNGRDQKETEGLRWHCVDGGVCLSVTLPSSCTDSSCPVVEYGYGNTITRPRNDAGNATDCDTIYYKLSHSRGADGDPDSLRSYSPLPDHVTSHFFFYRKAWVLMIDKTKGQRMP